MSKIEKSFLGTTKQGENVSLFTLTNQSGMCAQIMEYGATIVSIKYPDRNGNLQNIALGSDLLAYYESPCGYMGATVGRHANRLEDGEFTLNGIHYDLYKNNGNHHLHGGLHGFSFKVFAGEINNDSVCFTYYSPDLEENYPGNLTVKVTFSLTEKNELSIHYYAVSDQDTIVNLTNHSYFNLSGKADLSITDHMLKIYADQFTELGENGVPNGKIIEVAGTPFDFREFTPIGKAIGENHPQITLGTGYDHNFVLNDSTKNLHLAAELYSPQSGILLKTYTTLPGIQLYTGNFLNGSVTGREGITYNQRCAVCLETQFFPNAMRHPHFPSIVLKASDSYNHTTVYQLGIQ